MQWESWIFEPSNFWYVAIKSGIPLIIWGSIRESPRTKTPPCADRAAARSFFSNVCLMRPGQVRRVSVRFNVGDSVHLPLKNFHAIAFQLGSMNWQENYSIDKKIIQSTWKIFDRQENDLNVKDLDYGITFRSEKIHAVCTMFTRIYSYAYIYSKRRFVGPSPLSDWCRANNHCSD